MRRDLQGRAVAGSRPGLAGGVVVLYSHFALIQTGCAARGRPRTAVVSIKDVFRPLYICVIKVVTARGRFCRAGVGKASLQRIAVGLVTSASRHQNFPK